MINIIQIFTQSKPDVSKNGIIINPISCSINPKLNGENELEMEFAIDKDGLYKYIKQNNYIAVPTPDFDDIQLYKIYDTVKSMSGYSITAYARHIPFNLAKNVIFNKSLSICNGQQALDRILENTEFIGHSNITIQDARQYKLRNVQNVINGSEDDSFLNVWGGEISCNNYDLTINTKRGSDKGVRVTFGYNLEDIEEDINIDEVITRLYPYSGDLVLSGATPYVDSPLINSIGVLEDTIEFSDIKVKESTDDTEGFNTRAEAEAEMIRRCNKLFEKGLDKITANYIVKMQDLSKTTEYKALGYDVLEKICLGDTVHCYNKNIDIEVEARCISYKWDCVNEEYIEIELGQFISNYVNMQNNKIDNLYKTIIQTEQNILLKVENSEKKLSSRIDIQEEKIDSVVEQDGTGFGWELSKSAFKVACVGASGASVTIDENGQTIDDGRFRIKKNGTTVFYVDTSGTCTADGGFIVEDDGTSCSIGSNGITLTNANGYISGLYVLSNTTALKMNDDLYIGKGIFVTAQSYFHSNVYIDDILEVGSNTDIAGSLDVGDDLDVDGYFYGTGGEFLNDLYVDDTVFCETLEVMGGEKNCVQETKNYGLRKINAYETAEYFFADIGEGVIRNGECIVYIDDIFSECVNTSINYQVEIFEYKNRGSIIEVERYPSHFIVKGNVNDIEFGWELKAKRLGFENVRLAQRTEKYKVDTLSLEKDLLINEYQDNSDYLLENNVTDITNILLEEVV